MDVRTHRDLEVWKLSLDWVETVYRVSSAWPADERYGLTSQTRRAAVSVSANIAEGAGRRTTGEFLQFLGIARGSLAEVETLLNLSVRLGLTEADEFNTLMNEADSIGRMLSKLVSRLNERRQH